MKSDLFQATFNVQHPDTPLALEKREDVWVFTFQCTECTKPAYRRTTFFMKKNQSLVCKACAISARDRTPDETIIAKLSEFKSVFVSRSISIQPKGPATQVTFLCGGYADKPCGKEVTRLWNSIQDPRRKPLCQICAQPRLRGKDHPQYRHDLPDRAREDLRWRAADTEWRGMIYERDNHTCRISGEKGGRLAAHHLNSRTHFPEQKFLLENGITITEELHREFHRRKGCKRFPTALKFLEFYREKCTTGLDLILPPEILYPPCGTSHVPEASDSATQTAAQVC